MRAEILGVVASLDEATLRQEVHPGKWSLLEIVEHLVLSEEYMLAQLDGLDSTPAGRTPADYARYALVMAIIRFGIPVRIPSKRLAPQGMRSPDELRAAWLATQERLRQHVASADPGVPAFRHPVAGPMSTRQTIVMLEAHLRRHRKQLYDRLQGS